MREPPSHTPTRNLERAALYPWHWWTWPSLNITLPRCAWHS